MVIDWLTLEIVEFEIPETLEASKLMQEQKWAKAAVPLRRALEIAKGSIGEHAPPYFNLQQKLSECLVKAKLYREAVPFLVAVATHNAESQRSQLGSILDNLVKCCQ